MDQLKPILEGLSKHRFWVSCGLIAVLGLVVSYLATSSVRTQMDKYIADIRSQFTTTNGLSGIDPKEGLTGIPEGISTSNSVFPNKTTNTEMDRITDEAKAAAREAWEFQYNKQRQLLVFPADLSEDVRTAFRSYLPIESRLPRYNEVKPNNEARVEYRSAYGDYIRERLPQLAEMIGARWQPSASAGGSMGGTGSASSGLGASPGAGSAPGGAQGTMGAFPGTAGAGNDPNATEDTTQVVAWNPANQGYWLAASTQFFQRNGNINESNQPTTHQVMYLQEDLWVLEAIFSVIKGVNGDADANDLAAIKTIDHILVGASAGKIGSSAALDNNSAAPQAQGSAGMTPDQMRQAMGSMSSSGRSAGGGGAASGAAADASDPANLRYVDRDFEPLSASDFFKSLKATDPDDAYLQVAKRIPVRLGFQMREAALIELLAQCANSNPPIEVHQVRINRHKPEGGTLAGGAGAGGMGPGGSSGGAPMGPTGASMGGGGGSSSMGASVGGTGPGGMGSGAGANRSAAPAETDVVGVEIYGVVYIFNPVPAQDDENNILKLVNPPANQAADRRNPTIAVAN